MLYRLFRFNFLCRGFITVQALSTVCQALWNPNSILYRTSIAGEQWGLIILLGLSLCAVVSATDLLVNDLMPNRVYISLIRNNRHFGYMAMATLYLALIAPCLDSGIHRTYSIVQFAIAAFECVWLAWALILRAQEEGKPYAA